jgi:hypothetical protein
MKSKGLLLIARAALLFVWLPQIFPAAKDGREVPQYVIVEYNYNIY